MNTFGKNIKQYRIALGYTQEDIAEELNVQKSTISMWENGNNFPSVNTLYDICKILKATPNELLGLTNIEMPYYSTTITQTNSPGSSIKNSGNITVNAAHNKIRKDKIKELKIKIKELAEEIDKLED